MFSNIRIVIPLGVTPATLKNFTLYDMLGLAGELGASAGVEVRFWILADLSTQDVYQF